MRGLTLRSLRSSLFALRSRRGVASLPLVLALLAIIVAVGSALLTVSFSQSQAAATAGRTVQALQYADAGARDALIRIARDKTFSDTSGNYKISFVANGCTNGNGCATVTVSTASGAPGTPKVIVSTGQIQNTTRAVQVQVTFDASLNGEITSAVWTEQ